jgi:Hemolysins and related proteins containing CBS domains
MKIVKDTKHSRYPVFTSDSERVIGILHVKDWVDIKN